jgi:hypothetical protein
MKTELKICIEDPLGRHLIRVPAISSEEIANKYSPAFLQYLKTTQYIAHGIETDIWARGRVDRIWRDRFSARAEPSPTIDPKAA